LFARFGQPIGQDGHVAFHRDFSSEIHFSRKIFVEEDFVAVRSPLGRARSGLEERAPQHRLWRVLPGQERAQDERRRLRLDVTRRRGAAMAEAGREGELGGAGRWLAVVHRDPMARDPAADDPRDEQNRHTVDIMSYVSSRPSSGHVLGTPLLALGTKTASR